MKLIDMVVTDYLNIVASDAPAPGGGSAAAFCGAQGTGLVDGRGSDCGQKEL